MRRLILLPLLLAACQDNTTQQTSTAASTSTTAQTETVTAASTSATAASAPAEAAAASTPAQSPEQSPHLMAVQRFYDEHLSEGGGGLVCGKASPPLWDNPTEITEEETRYKTSVYEHYQDLEQRGYATIEQGPSSERPGQTAYIVTPTQKYLDVFGEPGTEPGTLCFGKKVATELQNLSKLGEIPYDAQLQTATVKYRVDAYTEDPIFAKGDPSELLDLFGLYLPTPDELRIERVTFRTTDPAQGPQVETLK